MKTLAIEFILGLLCLGVAHYMIGLSDWLTCPIIIISYLLGKSWGMSNVIEVVVNAGKEKKLPDE